MYTCGPTVYHFAHIGNLRAYIFEDVLEKTLNYLKDSKLNSFVINKAISKCRDSYRINNEDKKLLLNYKR